MRLDIHMDYSLRFAQGTAALRWTDPHQTGGPTQALLLALFYGRILSVHAETQSELMSRTTRASIAVLDSDGQAGFNWEPWMLDVGRGVPAQQLWPWSLCGVSDLPSPKNYRVTLKHGRPTSISPTGWWVLVEMAFGFERVLAPSSVLLAFDDFSRRSDPKSRSLLALIVFQMNTYWRNVGRIQANSEGKAYAYAEAAIRGTPQEKG